LLPVESLGVPVGEAYGVVLDRLCGARADLRRAGMASDVKETFELQLYKRDAPTKLGIKLYLPRVQP
jgi:hypothetical protein